MRSNSLQTLVTLEQEFGEATAAAAMQGQVVAGYRTSFESRATARSHGRLLAALQFWMKLCEAAGDVDGQIECRQQVEALPPLGK